MKHWKSLAAGLMSLVFLAGSMSPALSAGYTWQKDKDGSWIVQDASGKTLQSTWVSFNGTKYCLDEQGHPKKGWAQNEGHWYYLDSSDAAKTKWLHKDGSWYFFNPDGQMQTGWLKDANGSWYYLDPASGSMKTGWLRQGKDTFYLDNSGAMKTGWLKKEGSWYHLASDGKLVTSKWIDSTDDAGRPCQVYLDQNGKWTETKYPNSTLHASWKDAYKAELKKLKNIDHDAPVFGLAYIDDNDIPELIMPNPDGDVYQDTPHYWTHQDIPDASGIPVHKICTYNDGKVNAAYAYFDVELGKKTGYLQTYTITIGMDSLKKVFSLKDGNFQQELMVCQFLKNPETFEMQYEMNGKLYSSNSEIAPVLQTFAQKGGFFNEATCASFHELRITYDELMAHLK